MTLLLIAFTALNLIFSTILCFAIRAQQKDLTRTNEILFDIDDRSRLVAKTLGIDKHPFTGDWSLKKWDALLDYLNIEWEKETEQPKARFIKKTNITKR